MSRSTSGIIRAGQLSGMAGGQQAVAFNLDDVKERADAYLKSVRQQAHQLLADAQAEANAVREAAREAGRQEAQQMAKQELRQMVKQEVAALMPSLETTFQDISAQRDHWLHEWEQNALQLSLRIAEKVVAQAVEVNGSIPLGLVREALEIIAGSQHCQLQLHPDDIELLGEEIEQIIGQVHDVTQVEVVPNPQLTRGGCTARSEQGEVDQQLSARLERITSELLSSPASTATDRSPSASDQDA